MDNEEQVNDETLEVEEVEVETVDDEPEEDVDSLRSRLAKAEELANNYKVRAEKAEKGKPKQMLKARQLTLYQGYSCSIKSTD